MENVGIINDEQVTVYTIETNKGSFYIGIPKALNQRDLRIRFLVDANVNKMMKNYGLTGDIENENGVILVAKSFLQEDLSNENKREVLAGILENIISVAKEFLKSKSVVFEEDIVFLSTNLDLEAWLVSAKIGKVKKIEEQLPSKTVQDLAELREELVRQQQSVSTMPSNEVEFPQQESQTQSNGLGDKPKVLTLSNGHSTLEEKKPIFIGEAAFVNVILLSIITLLVTVGTAVAMLVILK